VEDTIIREKLGLALSWRRNPTLQRKKPAGRQLANGGRAEADVLDGAPPLGHQGEAAFALVAQGPQERVAGFRIDIEFAAGWLSHRVVHASAGPFVSGIGEDGQVLQVRPGFRTPDIER
jgi:hypothetical protein